MMLVPISINPNVVNKVSPAQMRELQRGFTSETLHIDDVVSHILSGHALNPAWLAQDESGHSVRRNDAFTKAQLIFLDIDNSVKNEHGEKRCKTLEEGYIPFEKVATNEAIQRNAFLVYTTPSHSDEWNRYRIVFCLPEPLEDVGKYKDILKAFIMRCNADEACKSPVHVYYGNTDALVHQFGNVLSQAFVDSVVHWSANLHREERVADESVNGSLGTEHVEAMLAAIPSKLEYIDWIRVISAVASRFDEDTTVRLIEAWSPGNPGEVRYKVRHRLQRIGIGTLIHIAKAHGYKVDKTMYTKGSLEEEAGITYAGVRYRLTQSGNAERFVDAHKNDVRYCVQESMWYVWDGKRLVADHQNAVSAMALRVFRDIIKEAADIDNADARTATLKWAKSCESRATIDASLDLAKRGTVLTVVAEDLDGKPLCVNLSNGIFDLETMTLCEHDIDELHTRIVPIDYVEDAECPKWLEFLNRIFAGDQEVIEFIQRAVGYTLCAYTSEECLFFAYGSGANGKSVFFSVLDMLSGGSEGYALKAKNELVMLRRGDPGVPMDIAELKGKRFVYTDELPDNRRFDESKIKDITSHDRLTGRFIFEKPFSFQPTHTLWMYGNHRPVITGQDDGIWRRIRLIPFMVTIPEGERRPPEELKAEFRAEASGILLWALKGFGKWRRYGLGAPASVKAATELYRGEMDTLQGFITEEISEESGSKLTHKELYVRYKAWCLEQGIAHIMTSRKLSMQLLEVKHWASELDRKASRVWIGRRLNQSFDIFSSAQGGDNVF